jgi:hypothetical protein
MNKKSPYDLNQLGVGFNQPCSKCGLAINRCDTPYETKGFKKICKCNYDRKKKNIGKD